jgi:NADH-quinone oxidoreductase subunit A
MPGSYLPGDYFPILIFIFLAGAFGIGSLLIGILVRPHRPYREKQSPYESGAPLFSDARVPFPLRYYIISMLFVIFDIEVIYLYPWAVAFRQIGLFGLVEMVLFILILLVGYFYAWQKGALEWD